MAKMTEDQVRKAVNSELDRASSFMDTRISTERAIAYDYYYGKPLGTEVDGRSQVVSCDVAQVVDSCLPALLKIFVSGDKAVEFTPRGPEDVKSAEQATLACNYVFFSQNNGYSLAHDFLKDGLLQKTGVFKWKWDTSVVMSEKRYQGLDDGTMRILSESPDVEIVEHTEYPDQMAMMQPPMPTGGQEGAPPPPMLHDVTVRVKKESGKVEVIVPLPEDILYSPDSTTLDVMKMPFIAHTPMLTASDLREMGIEQKVIDILPTGDRDEISSSERIARRDRTDASALVLGDDGAEDESQKVYRYNECYIRIDEDGDGVAELRKICMVGDEILHDEPVDHIPMAVWTPKVMPHEVVGMSLADEVIDIQLLKSTLWRGALDNLYLSIAPRMFAQGDINLDDVLTVKPGGVIRGGADASLTPVVVPSMMGDAYQMLEYADQEEEVRTGISRMFQGIDPESINKTATGVTALMNQANARVELMARNAAEYGFQPLFKGIMYLLAKHQQKALMVRLSNTFVPVDPETWSKEYDMTCNVGLGVGTKDQQLMHLQALGMDLQAVGQSPFGAQLLDAKKVFNYLQKKIELAGFKDVTTFVNDPEGTQPPPPQKPELVQAEEVKAQASLQKAQMDQQTSVQTAQMKQQDEAQKFQAQAMLDEKKMAQDMALAREEMALKMEFEREKMQAEFQFKLAEKQMELEAQREIAAMGAQSTVKAAAYSAKGMAPEDIDNEKAEKEQEKANNSMLLNHIAQLIAQSAAPKEIVRGKDGRAIGVRPVQ